jgi:hypothetical protein
MNAKQILEIVGGIVECVLFLALFVAVTLPLIVSR